MCNSKNYRIYYSKFHVLAWFVVFTTGVVVCLIGLFLSGSLLSSLLVLTLLLNHWYSYFRGFLEVYKRRPALELLESHFNDSYNGVLIEWKDVEAFWEEKGLFSNSLTVLVKNKKKYLKEIKNPITRLQQLYNIKKDFLVLSLSFDMLDSDKDKVISAIEMFDLNEQEKELHIT